MFGTKEVAAYYKKTDQTVRAWAEEFGEYLSPLANPGKGKGRTFSIEDLSVFALIAELKDQNKTYEDIHATLRAGHRGEPPSLTEKDLKLLSATEGEKRAAFEIQALQRHIFDLQERLNKAEERAVEAELLKIEKAQLDTRVQMLEQQLSTSSGQVQQLIDEVKQLSVKLGREYAQGFKDGLREQGGLPEKDE